MLGRALTFRRDGSKVHPARPRGLHRLDSRALKSWCSGVHKTPSPEDERQKNAMLEEIRLGPRRALVRNIKVYLRFLRYVVIFSAVMFAIFSFEGYAIRNLLCKRLAQELGGAFFGFHECVLGGFTSSNPYRAKGAAIFWLIFYSIQYSWLSFFPVLISLALYREQFLLWHKIATIIIVPLPTLMLCIAGPVMNLSFDNYVLIAISTACSGAMLSITGDVVRRHPTSNGVMVVRWILLFVLCSAATTFYLTLVPSIITLRSGDALGGTGILIVRLLIHPVIWSAVLTFLQQFLRHRGSMPGMMQLCFLMFPLVYSSVFGRFLLLQLDSAGSIFLINLAQGCYTLGARLSDRASNGLWLTFLYGDRGADARIATHIVEELRLMEMLASSLAENGGIVAASALLSFGHVSIIAGRPPNHGLIWLNAVGQIITGVVLDFLGLVVEGKFHAFKWERVLPKSMTRTITFTIIVIVIGSSRKTNYRRSTCAS